MQLVCFVCAGAWRLGFLDFGAVVAPPSHNSHDSHISPCFSVCAAGLKNGSYGRHGKNGNGGAETNHPEQALRSPRGAIAEAATRRWGYRRSQGGARTKWTKPTKHTGATTVVRLVHLVCLVRVRSRKRQTPQPPKRLRGSHLCYLMLSNR